MKKSTWVFFAVLSVLLAGGLAYRHFAQELDARGATRLMRALEENDTDKMEELLERGDINARDKSGQTALFYAARHAQHPQIIHKLLLAGADPFSTDKHGYTPLMVAASSNPSAAITRVLARQGGLSAAQQHNKDNALRVAARSNVFGVIKMLLVVHANPASTDEQGRRAADYLAENPQLTDNEKADLRQVMLLLEILQAREQFTAHSPAQLPDLKTETAAASVSAETVKKPVEKKLVPPAPAEGLLPQENN